MLLLASFLQTQSTIESTGEMDMANYSPSGGFTFESKSSTRKIMRNLHRKHPKIMSWTKWIYVNRYFSFGSEKQVRKDQEAGPCLL